MARSDELRVVTRRGEHTDSTVAHMRWDGHSLTAGEHINVAGADDYRYAVLTVAESSTVRVEAGADGWKIRFGMGLVVEVDDAVLDRLSSALGPF